MESGKWKVKSGKWEVEFHFPDGNLVTQTKMMESGKWKVESGKFSTLLLQWTMR